MANSRYGAYVASIQDKIPKSALACMQAPWYYDPADPRCPHDSRVRVFSVFELESEGTREIRIRLGLAGAYDNTISIEYMRVDSYNSRPIPDGACAARRGQVQGAARHDFFRSREARTCIRRKSLALISTKKYSPLDIAKRAWGGVKFCCYTRADFLRIRFECGLADGPSVQNWLCMCFP